MKTANSLIIFPRQWCAKHGRSKKNAHCKIQKFRSDGKELTESQNKRIQRISKVAHSSGQWTEVGVGKMLIRSIRSLSARRKVYGDKMRYYLYLEEYISILNWSSDTAVALSPTKRVYAILRKNETLFGHYLYLREYIPSCEKWKICLAIPMLVRWAHFISFSSKRKWAHRKTVQSKSCCVIFIYRSIHSLRSPCFGRWSWGTTITSLLPVAPVAIVITLSLVCLLRLPSLFVTSSFHLIGNVGTLFTPNHTWRFQVNKNRVVSVSVCRCNHEDFVITG